MKRTPMFLVMLLLVSCFGPSTEPFGSPRHISVANWEGWCGLRTDIVRVFTRFFVDQTLTKASFENQAFADDTATSDWADLAQSDGANDIATKLRAVYLAVGHATVAVDKGKDTTPSRDELATALSALPRCPSKNAPASNAALQASSSIVSTSEPIRDCLTSDVTVGISTESASYDQGQPVHIRVMVKNIRSSACGVVTNPCVANVFVVNSQSTRVWESNAAKPCSPSGQTIFQPGKPHDMWFVWNQLSCSLNTCDNSQVPSGDYQARARLPLVGGSNSGLGSAQFTIRPPVSPPQRSPSPTPTPTLAHGSHSPSASPTPSSTGSPII